MITVCHVVDETAGWEQRVAIAQLLDRLPRDRFRQVGLATSGAAVRAIGQMLSPVHVAPALRGLPWQQGALMSRFVERQGADLVHAWGPGAAAAVAALAIERAVVLEVFDPRAGATAAKLLLTLDESARVGVICAAELVRRRLIENGVPVERCAVIRPGVDFQRINQWRRRPVREELGMAPEDRVVIVPPEATRGGGQFEAFWAASLLNHLERNVRVLVPGDTRERRRIARFAAGLPTQHALIDPDSKPGTYSFEQLLVHADTLLAAGREEASTTAIAWAMAAGVPVIAAATRANAELIAHKVGGLLYKPLRDGSDAPAIVRLLKDRESQAKVKEVASGQAYEVFGLRRYVEQHARLYENVLSRREAAEGIADPARAT